MNKITWIVIAVVVLVGLGGLIAFTRQGEANVESLDPASIIAGENGSIGDHTYGKTNAKIVVFEYADFQCSGCKAAFPSVKSVKEQYKDKITFVFRNFPITNSHPNALAASSVAEAAGQQGKFWEMYDLLFTKYSSWSNLGTDKRGAEFISYAKQLGLDIEKFTSDQASKAVAEKINRDRALGAKAGVNATPSFFIGSSKLDSDVVDEFINGNTEGFTSKIDDALKAVGETPPVRQ